MKSKAFFLMMIFFVSMSSAIAIMGQPFELKQTAIATSGGGTSSGGSFSLDSTIGQKAATTDSLLGGMFRMRTGFRTPPPFAPTSATAQIQGRVLLGKDRGIKNAFVTLTGGAFPTPIAARTNQFGYFNFNNIEVGHFYILSVRHKRYSFSQNTLSFMLFNDSKGLVFHADRK